MIFSATVWFSNGIVHTIHTLKITNEARDFIVVIRVNLDGEGKDIIQKEVFPFQIVDTNFVDGPVTGTVSNAPKPYFSVYKKNKLDGPMVLAFDQIFLSTSDICANISGTYQDPAMKFVLCPAASPTIRYVSSTTRKPYRSPPTIPLNKEQLE